MNDLIERQAAIKAVHKNYDTILDFKSDGRTVADSFEDIINALPFSQPEPKTGYWIILDSDSERYEDIKCPFCGHTFTVDAWRWCDIGFIKEDFKFCPNCGAKIER